MKETVLYRRSFWDPVYRFEALKKPGYTNTFTPIINGAFILLPNLSFGYLIFRGGEDCCDLTYVVVK